MSSIKDAHTFPPKCGCYLVLSSIDDLALGFPAPFLWGALAFVLNYIPYVGPGIMHVIFFIIGLLTFDTFWPALIASRILLLPQP